MVCELTLRVHIGSAEADGYGCSLEKRGPQSYRGVPACRAARESRVTFLSGSMS
jgi:hypothetical protein